MLILKEYIFEETFTLVSGMESMRMILSYTFSKDIELYEMDIKLDFINGVVEE